MALVLGLAAIGGTLYALHQCLASLTVKWTEDRKASESAARLSRSLEDRRIAVEEGRLALEQRRVAMEEKAKEASAPPPPMPDDLKARIDAWEDPWAKEDQKATLMQMFAEYGDWDIVRTKLVPLRIAMDVADIPAPREEWMA